MTTELDNQEIAMVSGGSSIVGHALLATFKKMSMVYCVGKELKHGVQAFDAWSLAKAGSCVFMALAIKEKAGVYIKEGRDQRPVAHRF